MGIKKQIKSIVFIPVVKDILIVLIWLLGLLIVYAYFRTLAIIFFLLLLDHAKVYLKVCYSFEFPLDFGLLAVVLLGYSGTPAWGFVVVPILVGNRFSRGWISPSFVVKYPLIIALGYLAMVINFYPLAIVGTILIVIRYAVEYLIYPILFHDVELERIGWRILTILLSYFFYYTFGQWLLGFM